MSRLPAPPLPGRPISSHPSSAPVPRIGAAAERAALALLLLLAVSLPFEWRSSVFDLSGVAVRGLRIVNALLLLAVVVTLLAGRRGRRWLPDLELGLPCLALAAVSLLSALLASDHHAASVHQALGVLEGVGLLVATMLLVGTRTRREALLTALLASAAALAAIGLIEVSAGGALAPMLSPFSDTLARPRHFPGLGATFGSGDLASAFLQPAVMLSAAWYLAARDRLASTGSYLLFCLLLAADLRAFSPIGWLALALGVATITFLIPEASPWRRASLAVSIPAMAAVLAIADPLGATRALEGAPARRYGALVRTSASELAVRPGKPVRMLVELTNAGTFQWGGLSEAPITVGVRWFDGVTGALVKEDARAAEVPPVPAGEEATVLATTTAPVVSGPVIMAVDVVEDGTVWFERMTHSAAVLRCSRVAEDLLDCRPAGRADLNHVAAATGPAPPPQPGGRVLWEAAISMIKTHPLLGEGPDGFRHSYWRYVDADTSDPRARVGNLYLQTTAETGVLGLLALLWLITAILWRLWTALHRSPSVSDRLLAGALMGTFVAFVIQGSSVSILGHGGLFYLFWILAGLAAALNVPTESRPRSKREQASSA